MKCKLKIWTVKLIECQKKKKPHSDINYHQGLKLYQQKQSYSELYPASLCNLLVMNGWELEEPQRYQWIYINQEPSSLC